MGKFLSKLAFRITLIIVMSSFMTMMPLLMIFKTDIEFLQNVQALSLTMFAATLTTSILLWMHGRGKK